jgi:hypothetical protein
MLARSDGILGRLATAAGTREPWLRVSVSPRLARFLIAAGASSAQHRNMQKSRRAVVRTELQKRRDARDLLRLLDRLAFIPEELRNECLAGIPMWDFKDYEPQRGIVSDFQFRVFRDVWVLGQLSDIADLLVELRLVKNKGDHSYSAIRGIASQLDELIVSLQRHAQASLEETLNLSGVFIGDQQIVLDDLDGVIWDRLTVWPSRQLADQVRAQSEELERPGLYRVRLGAQHHAGVR